MQATLKDKWLWITVIVSGIALFPVLIEPLGFDDFLPHIVARDYLHHGRIPYLQNFDQSFPGIFYLHIVEIALLGDSAIALRAFDILLELLFAVFLYLFMQKWTNRAIAAQTALLYILFYVGSGRGVFGQRDVYVGMTIFLSAA